MMLTNSEIEGKLKHILIEISKTNLSEKYLIELLEHSSFKFKDHWNQHSFPNLFDLELTIPPEIFTKNYSSIENFGEIIKDRIITSSHLLIDEIRILPNYHQLQIIDSKVFSVLTDWDEINDLQNKLIGTLQTSKQSIDFQGIGLISRTIMNKLSRQVFYADKHKPSDLKKNVSDGYFKNQLHTYIDTVLSGESNFEFRRLAKSSIDFVEDSIDFMNKTTHKLDAEKHLAEVCVVSTITAISIVKLIKQLE